MSKLTHESLRQMISEEISKLEASKSEPKSVKVTAKQLRGIILQEVRSMNEQQEEIEMDTLNIDAGDPPATPEGALVIRRDNDSYVYAVDDEGVWIVSSPKKELGEGDAIMLDPVKYASAIRKIMISLRADLKGNTEEYKLISKHAGEHESQRIKDFKTAYAAEVNDKKNMSSEETMATLKKVAEDMGAPNFSNIPMSDIADALKFSTQESAADDIMLRMRQLKGGSPSERAQELFKGTVLDADQQ